MDHLELLYAITLSLFVPSIVVYLFISRRRRRANLDGATSKSKSAKWIAKEAGADEPHDEAALKAAEDELRDLPIDMREKLIETHILIQRFHTSKGVSKQYMDALAAKLRESDIPCEILFQETMVMGFGDAILEPRGIFELYVRKDKEVAATKLLPTLLA